MSNVSWRLNGAALETYGFDIVGGNFRTHGVSTLRLHRPCDIDAGEALAYDAAVFLEWLAEGGEEWQPFFRGKCVSVPKHGSAQSEGHTYEISDAWADLETTTYQELWAQGVAEEGDPASVSMPRSIFGMSADGVNITTAAMIENIITMSGVDLDIGEIPAGLTPLPSEMSNVFCMQLLLRCLELHPDWVPFIDHTTAPNSTFNVRAAGTGPTLNLEVGDGSGQVEVLEIVERLDLMPVSVRIIYETAGDFEGPIRRRAPEDLWPPGGATSGPRVLCAHIPLAGQKSQTQKARLYCETLPDSQETAKEWLKKNYPQLREIDDSHFNVTAWTRTLMPEPSDIDDNPISAQARRIAVTDAEDLPRHLLNGSVESWMRLKVGTVLIDATLAPTETATAEEAALLIKLPPLLVTATNAAAGSSVHQGVSHWEPGEAVPTGVAEAVYKGIRAGCMWQGRISFVADEIPLENQLGLALNLTGAAAAWETMRAPISSVDWDADSGKCTLGFGPLPTLAPQDIIEQMRRLTSRPVKWWSTEERISDSYGAAATASAGGDTVGGYDYPIRNAGVIGGGSGSGAQPFELVASGTPGDNILKVRESTIASMSPSGFTAGIMELTISDAEGVVYAKMTINGTTGAVTAVAVEKATEVPDNTDTVYHELIGRYTVEGSGGEAVITAWNVRYGPIPATVCRDHHVSEAPYYGVTFL